jgi:hypothetical protein
LRDYLVLPRVIQKNFFGHYAGGRRRGLWPFFGLNLQKWNRGGGGEGRGQNLKKRAKFTFFVNLFFKEFLLKILSK